MDNDLLDTEIAEALAALRDRYPGQKVWISVTLEPGEPTGFFASVEHVAFPYDSECCLGRSAHEAIEKLIAKVGDHNQFDATEAKKKQLLEELKSLGWHAAGDNEPTHPTERNYGLPRENP